MLKKTTYKVVRAGKILEVFVMTVPVKSGIPRDKSISNRDYVGDSDIRLDNALRTKSRFKRLVRSNPDLNKFITLTFADNITDLTYANKQFNQFIKRLTNVFPDLKYIAVPEFQKRGAVHYHILVNIASYYDNASLNVLWGFGFVNIKNLRKMKINRIDLYMSKYLTKDIDNRLFSRRRYLYSKNIKKPMVFTTSDYFGILRITKPLKLLFTKTIDFEWGATLTYFQYSIEFV